MSYNDNYDIFADDDKLALTKRGKPRKRKPKEPRIYFTQDTEDAIVEYLITVDTAERNRIYNDDIVLIGATARASVNINWAIDQYILFAAQNAATSDRTDTFRFYAKKI